MRFLFLFLFFVCFSCESGNDDAVIMKINTMVRPIMLDMKYREQYKTTTTYRVVLRDGKNKLHYFTNNYAKSVEMLYDKYRIGDTIRK